MYRTSGPGRISLYMLGLAVPQMISQLKNARKTVVTPGMLEHIRHYILSWLFGELISRP